MNEKPQTLKPFGRICMTIGQLPASYVESMSYYEQLIWLTKYLQEQVIPVVNNNSQVVEELQEYVEHYFDNLDVQQEINNKLDEMAESGELEEIISAYLNSRVIFGFDTIADMKASTNLIDGSYAKTLGYYSIDDGGGAIYKITDTSTPSIYQEELDSGLYANLEMTNDLYPEMFGYSDDVGATINTMLSYGIKTIHLNAKKYTCKTTINLTDKEYISIYGKNKMSSVICGETGNTPVINMVGSLHINMENFSINSTTGFASSTPSTLGIVIARTTTHLSSQEHIFRNLNIRLDSSNGSINDNYGSIAVYNWAGESFLFDNCMIHSYTPIFFTNFDLLEIGSYYGGYNYSGKTTTDFTFNNDCYVLSEGNICMKFDTCHSINVTDIYLNVKNSGNVFEFNSHSSAGYEFNNVFINNIRVEGTGANLIHLLESTKLRNFHVVGGSNTITNADYLMENNCQIVKGYHQFQDVSQYTAKKASTNATMSGVIIVGDYDKKLDVVSFDRSILIGSVLSNRNTISSFNSICIDSTGHLVLNGGYSIMYSYNIPTNTTNFKTGDICFCNNISSNVLCWQYDNNTTTWNPIYKVTSP